MSFGLVEIITLLLGLAGFSLQQNPKAPTQEQSLQYAMPDADIVMHVDATAVIGNNYKLLVSLPDQSGIKASPELSKLVRKAIGEVDGLKGLVKTTTGLDLTTDISDADLFLKIHPPNHPPEIFVAVRGKFTPALMDRLAKMLGPPVKVGAGAMIVLPGGAFPVAAIGVTKDGTFLAGGEQQLRDRLADTWKAPPRAPGSNLAHVASVLVSRPIFAVAMTMSPAARKIVGDEFKGEKNFVTDVVARHKLAAFMLYHDGIGWTWIDSNKAGLEAMTQISEGVMDTLRASQIAPRGFAKIAMGAIESYRGNKQVDELIKHKADIWKIVESYTGDGSFKVAINKDPATLKLTARATGKSLSEVLPAGMLLPGAMFALLSRTAPTPAPPRQVPAPAQPPKLTPPPAKKP